MLPFYTKYIFVYFLFLYNISEDTAIHNTIIKHTLNFITVHVELGKTAFEICMLFCISMQVNNIYHVQFFIGLFSVYIHSPSMLNPVKMMLS